jgi:hypothetical protein
MKEKVRSTAILSLTIIVLLLTSTRLPADTGTCGGAMTTLPFTDVGENFFFCQIAEAYFSGLTIGTTPSTYSPDDFVRRDQMAAFGLCLLVLWYLWRPNVRAAFLGSQHQRNELSTS